MRAAGTRVHFKFEMPSRTESGTGVVSPEGDDGFLVLDDVRFDSGASGARVWIPIAKLRVLWADELPELPELTPPAVVGDGGAAFQVGAVVLDRYGSRWVLFPDRLWSSARYPGSSFTIADLVMHLGPVTFHGHDHDDDKAGR